MHELYYCEDDRPLARGYKVIMIEESGISSAGGAASGVWTRVVVPAACKDGEMPGITIDARTISNGR